jgi:glycosyltransferase involved in cell wall biosynthesis
VKTALHICYVGDARSLHVQRWAQFFVERGHRVSVITDRMEEISGAAVYDIGEGLLPFRLPVVGAVWQIAVKARRIRRLVLQLRPDILHGHYATNYGFLASLAGFTPLVQTVHGSDLLVDAQGAWEQRWFVRHALRRATLITAVTRDLMHRVVRMGIPAERVLIHQYGVDTSVFTRPPDPGTRRPGRVVSTRRFEWKYNVFHLIRALPGVRARVPDVEVVLAGDGPDRQALEALIRELGVEAAVTLAGHVAHEAIPALLQSAAVYVSTAVTEGASLSLLEAMACGVFPVVTDIPGNREWVTDDENGFLVPVNDVEALADRIATAFEQPALRQAAASRNFDLIRRRGDYRRNMTKMEAVYLDILHDYRDAFSGE